MRVTYIRHTASIVAIVLGYTWVIIPLFGVRRWLSVLPIVFVLILCMWRAVQIGEWGLERSQFLPAFGWALLFTLPSLMVIYMTGGLLGSVHNRVQVWSDFIYLIFWGGGQQFALQTVVLREIQQLVSPKSAIGLAAVVFALLHFPNPFLTGVTLVAALGWCWIYSRHSNLLPLVLSHAVGTLGILHCFDTRLTGGMRVAYSSLQLWLE